MCVYQHEVYLLVSMPVPESAWSVLIKACVYQCECVFMHSVLGGIYKCLCVSHVGTLVCLTLYNCISLHMCVSHCYD